MRIIVLGSGASSGTPAIDWGWGKCDPTDPRNRRTRPSILVEKGDTRILIDSSPDLREQLLSAKVSTLTAVVYTHAHADHLHGIDDLRAVNRALAAPLDMYADGRTLDIIRKRFGYVLEPLDAGARFYYKPTLTPHVMHDGDSFTIADITVTAFEQSHGFSTTMGLRFDDFAYTTDVVDMPERGFEVLAGIDTWMIGTLVDVPHSTHCHVDKALDWIGRVRPRHAVLTHLGCDLDHETLAKYVPAGVEPAFDGMVIDLPAREMTMACARNDSRGDFT